MVKELLKITRVKGSICLAESHFETKTDKEQAAASLLSLLDEDEEFAQEIFKVFACFMLARNKVSQLNKLAKRSAEIKTKN